MPDWKKLVRERIASSTPSAPTEPEVVSELAAHLEETYAAALSQGMIEEAATEFALQEVPDWHVLAANIRIARSEGGFRERPHPKSVASRTGQCDCSARPAHDPSETRDPTPCPVDRRYGDGPLPALAHCASRFRRVRSTSGETRPCSFRQSSDGWIVSGARSVGRFRIRSAGSSRHRPAPARKFPVRLLRPHHRQLGSSPSIRFADRSVAVPARACQPSIPPSVERKPRAESLKSEAESLKPEAESRKPEAGSPFLYSFGATYSFGFADPSPKKNCSNCFTITS